MSRRKHQRKEKKSEQEIYMVTFDTLDLARMEYQIKMEIYKDTEEYKRAQHSAAYLDKDKCMRCGACCYKAPCKVKDMKNLKDIANYLGLSVKEVLSKYFTVYEDDWGDIYLVPIRKKAKHTAGTYLRDKDIPSKYSKREPCIFYEEENGLGKCMIQCVKPEEGAEYFCNSDRVRSDVEYRWDINKLKELGMNVDYIILHNKE